MIIVSLKWENSEGKSTNDVYIYMKNAVSSTLPSNACPNWFISLWFPGFLVRRVLTIVRLLVGFPAVRYKFQNLHKIHLTIKNLIKIKI